MHHFSDSAYGAMPEDPSLGASLAIAMVLVLAAMSAAMLIAGG